MKKILISLMFVSFLYAGEDGPGITPPPPSGGTSASSPNTWTGEQTYTVPMIWQHSATPANPSAGYVRVYVKNDNLMYIKNSAGTETQVGGVGTSLTAMTSITGQTTGSFTVAGGAGSSSVNSLILAGGANNGGDGGNVTIRGGASTGGFHGNVQIGTSNTTGISIGTAGSTQTDIFGALSFNNVTSSITMPDNIRQTFNPGATNSGFNVGSHAGDPSTPTDGDLWYDSTANELTARINGANVSLTASTASAQYTKVRVATTVAGTLATDYENGDTVDAVVLATNDRILIKNQATKTANGIYIVNASGSPTRSTDLDASNEFIPYNFVRVTEGTANRGRIFKLIVSDTFTLSTNDVDWASDTIASTNGTGTNAANVLLGRNAAPALQSASSLNNLVIGDTLATGITSSSTNLFIGNSAMNTLTGGSGNLSIGHSSNASGASNSNMISIGNSNTVNDGSIVIGATASSTATGQFVAGSNTAPISTIFFAKGPTHTSASGWTLTGTGGSGTNNAGGNVGITSGIGTGTAKSGTITLSTAPSIASGSTVQTAYQRYIVVAQGTALTDAVATTLATWTLSSGSTGGGRICATIRVTDGTDFQSMTQYIEVALVNKAGTYTTNITATTGAKAVSAGTLTTTWTVTSAGAVQLSADTSLTPSGTNAFVVYYTIENNSQSNVTLP